MTNIEVLLKAVRHQGFNVLSLALVKDVVHAVAEVLDESDLILINKQEFYKLLKDREELNQIQEWQQLNKTK